jgi:histidyl-tRNA synthetase
MTLSKNPPRGTYDFFPEDFAIQKYIFDTWRKVCTGFGYQEYLGPIVEPAEIWRAKSGEDVGGTELTVITDRTGQPSELALRPEMTPTVTRMVSKIYNEVPKPIRYFSIANFYRNERPQRGRNREFWQLNYDLFGSESLLADVEIIQIAIELILAFDPPKNAFRVSLGNRKMLDAFLSDIVQVEPSIKTQVVRTMDKWEKLSREDFEKTLGLVGLKEDQREKIVLFLSSLSLAQFAERFPIMMENA